MPAVQFDNVFFSFTEPVLSGASFSIEKGQTVALIGDNGSGKSTIAKICAAELAPAEGTAEVLSKNIADMVANGSELEIRQHIGVVLQNPDDQLVSSLVIDEVAFGPENLGLPRNETIRRVDHALRKVGMLDHIGSNVNTLSGGQKQRIAIADALAMDPELLILDEVTSMLDSGSRAELLGLLRELHDDGMTIMLITHSLEEALMCDRVLEVKEGKVCELADEDEVIERLSYDRVVVAANRLRNEQSPEAKIERSASNEYALKREANILEFEDVSFTYSQKDERGIDIFGIATDNRQVLSHLDLSVREGETMAITGVNGSGKSTLLRLANGLLAPTAGIVSVCGSATSSKEGANHARRCVGISFQYPERFIFCDTVYDEVAFAPRNMGLSDEEVDLCVRESMDGVGLSFDKLKDRNPHGLSGGEQRKVSIAGVLAMRPKVLAFDEPCASLDIPARIRFWELIGDLKGNGQTILLVSHDAQEIALLADRVFELEMLG